MNRLRSDDDGKERREEKEKERQRTTTIERKMRMNIKTRGNANSKIQKKTNNTTAIYILITYPITFLIHIYYMEYSPSSRRSHFVVHLILPTCLVGGLVGWWVVSCLLGGCRCCCCCCFTHTKIEKED